MKQNDTFDALIDGFYEADAAGRLTRVNRALAELFGRSPEAMLGRGFDEFAGPAMGPTIRGCFKRCREGDSRGELLEWKVLRKDRPGTFAEISVSPLHDEQGEVRGFHGVARESSQRWEVERRLTAARDEAISAARRKSAFLANMSHEIRTPMSSIIGMTELALQTEVTQEQAEYLTTVKESADSLLGVINDILDFSKIEAGRLELEQISFDVRDSVADILKMLSFHSQQKNLELVYEISEQVPERIVGDPGRLRQILVNLVHNSIKFTERGEIVVRARVERSGSDRATLRFDVSDTGVGIPPERQAFVFESFTQLATRGVTEPSGSGLGLSISAQLVQAMGGRIWVESEPGVGSTFSFLIDVGVDHESSARHTLAGSDKLNGLRILIADDNRTTLRILSESLRRSGLAPTPCGDGAAARSALRDAAARREPFSVAVLDAQMSGVDGFQLAQEIRANPALGGAKVVLLSPAGIRGDAARCRAIGISGYLPKPIAAEDLLHSLRAIVGQSGSRPRHNLVTRHSLRESRPSLRVLVADDNAVNRMVTRKLLQKSGHRVVLVETGREAIDLLASQRFDVVLMDVQMPIMDGLEATALIREGERATGQHIPIIALTAHAMRGDRERFLAAGMDAYLSKPFQLDDLLTVIDSVHPEDGSHGVPGSSRTRSICADPASSAQIIDPEQLMAQVCDDLGLLDEVVEMFVDETPKMVATLDSALREGDPVALEQGAHRLKGTLGVVAAKSAADVALCLESLGRGGQLDQSADVRSTLDTLKQMIDQVERELLILTRSRRDASHGGASLKLEEPKP